MIRIVDILNKNNDEKREEGVRISEYLKQGPGVKLDKEELGRIFHEIKEHVDNIAKLSLPVKKIVEQKLLGNPLLDEVTEDFSVMVNALKFAADANYSQKELNELVVAVLVPGSDNLKHKKIIDLANIYRNIKNV
ncbi:hypothetical protein A2276_07690 [candidate division WOR-1 bacterium RIFOXYA12_FULL_43_27]|uniref:Uncharacterized protein n=1 Tax=candidate division WOR-1 bacterium RIFOXYC2_FULL_46_14 TaxID=1802587 RepID=A0A1F4U5S6_UNCSA|nr:MAG: hypothetical protein A2276_07690 [candidate division WOR-1 bacterium RIFOXYA12_FULL_43_27]OGC20480.1 MAG: hypothetical protein A2292_05515 [candidate division WOR-1 bacterium RIFOXYB2_FULL_46_45]OGC31783.1 MAG: hypothetical protein A2232_05935 [candidate division WOR-1 bacterium RIFOXYA2_FULL_46_56]OGC40325.1 MAG: hypothetical protein A2438_03535 [candidate division WOR-1 bacterium RIFOXYC2_FULL_46_14]